MKPLHPKTKSRQGSPSVGSVHSFRVQGCMSVSWPPEPPHGPAYVPPLDPLLSITVFL